MAIERPATGATVTSAWGQSVADALNVSMPRGLVAIKLGTANSLAVGGTAQPLYSLAASLVAGRAYEVSFDVRALAQTAAPASYNFTGSATPAIPNFGMDCYHAPPYNYGSLHWSAIAQPTATGVYTFAVTVAVVGSTGRLFADTGCSIRVTDIGAAVAVTP